MKKMTCEICGSTDFIKENGVFVCQSCDMKYSLEDVKKLLGSEDNLSTEKTAETKTEENKKLDNLYELARRARKEDNVNNAAEYYQKILYEDPSSWEANYFTVYYQAMQCKIGEIGVAAKNLINCQEDAIRLIKENLDDEEQLEAVKEIGARNIKISNMLGVAAVNHLTSITNIQVYSQYEDEYIGYSNQALNILYVFGDLVEKAYEGNKPFTDVAVSAWKQATINLAEYGAVLGSFNYDKERFEERLAKYETVYANKVKAREKARREEMETVRKNITNKKDNLEKENQRLKAEIENIKNEEWGFFKSFVLSKDVEIKEREDKVKANEKEIKEFEERIERYTQELNKEE